MPRHPGVYARMLGDRIHEHGAKVWLVNTGWTGGPYGVGERMKLAYTRRMVSAALSGELDEVATNRDPVFGFEVPSAVEGVPSEVLSPRATWADASEYDERAAQLAQMFVDNFEQFAEGVTDEIVAAAPRPSRSEDLPVRTSAEPTPRPQA